MIGERLVIHAPAVGLSTLAEEAADRVYASVAMLAPGIYRPGIGGPHAGKRIRFSEAVIRTMAPTMEAKKVNLEHRQSMEDEVGFIRGVQMPDAILRGDFVLQAVRTKFMQALAFIEGRIRAGIVPEVSVEIVQAVFREAAPEEQHLFDLDLMGGVFDGCSLVPKGACSAAAGCGIGMCAASQNPPPGSSGEGSDKHMTGEDKPGAGGNGGGGQPCGCAEASAKSALEQRATNAENALKAEQEAHTKTKTALTAAQEKVVGFEKAEHTRVLAALQEKAGEKADLSAILGCKPEEASVTTMQVALRSIEATGRVGMQAASGGRSPGRFTSGAGPGGKPGGMSGKDREAAVSGMKESRLGLTAEKTFLPATFHKNTARLKAQGQ